MKTLSFFPQKYHFSKPPSIQYHPLAQPRRRPRFLLPNIFRNFFLQIESEI